jgi:hypothetical protein
MHHHTGHAIRRDYVKLQIVECRQGADQLNADRFNAALRPARIGGK